MSIFGSPNIVKLKQKQNSAKLIKILHHNNDINIRIDAARALGDLPGKDVIDALVSACREDDNNLSEISEKSLINLIGKLTSNHASDMLIYLLESTDCDRIRLETMKALGSFSFFKEQKVQWAMNSVVADEKANYDFIKAVFESIKNLWVKETLLDAILGSLIWISDSEKQKITAAHFTELLGDEPLKRLLFRLEKDIRKPWECWDDIAKVGVVIGAFGDHGIELLIDMMNNHKNPNVRNNAAFALGETRAAEAVTPLMEIRGINHYIQSKALCKIGDKRATEHVLKHIFGDPLKIGEYNIEFEPDALKPLFGKYAEWLGCMVSDLPEGTVYINWKMNKLCNIKTKVSTNILHIIKTVRDYSRDWVNKFDRTETTYTTFDSLRAMAETELANRGNPEYDPKAFLDESAW